MTKEGKSKKVLLIIVCFVVAIIAVVATIIIINSQKTQDNEQVVEDDPLQITDTRLVISSAADDPNDKAKGAIKVHQIYNIDGEKVLSSELYIEYANETMAAEANFDSLLDKSVEEGFYKSHRVKGKFVIIEMPEEYYQSITASQVRKMMNGEGIEEEATVDAETGTE